MNRNNLVEQVLSETCSDNLLVLDVEHSKGVKDESIPFILSCSRIKELNIFHTGLSTAGQANILKNLKNLEMLSRGDFLCDVLEHIEWEEPEQIDKYGITI